MKETCDIMICELASGIEEAVRCRDDLGGVPLLKIYAQTVLLSAWKSYGRPVCLAGNGIFLKSGTESDSAVLWTTLWSKQTVSSSTRQYT